jgi:hypothetical protein
MHAQETMTSEFGGKTTKMWGSGDFDFSNSEAELTINGFGTGSTDSTATIMFVDGNKYLQAPPPFGQAGKWIEVPGQGFQSGAGQQSLPEVGQSLADPAAGLRILAQSGSTVVPLGPTAVDGVPVQGYAITLSEQSIRSAEGNNALQALSPAVPASGAKIDVYIDGSGLVRREVTSQKSTSGPLATQMTSTLDLSRYGESVTITPPPSSEISTPPTSTWGSSATPAS